MGGKLLWGPGKARNLSRLAQDLGMSDDYHEIHRYSIQNTKEFWSKIWEHFSLIGNRGKHVLSYNPGDDLCEAEWFKDTTLNYSENILRLNPRHGQTSISFISEEGSDTRQDISYEDLCSQVLACTAALRANGIGKGDVVAGWLANCPHSIITMLAVTRIGAIWSSCSPDFGVEAILDRFSQIEPKLIFTHDYYSYKGKKFIMDDACNKVSSKLSSVQRIVRVPFLESQGDWDDFLTMGRMEGTSDLSLEVEFNHPLFIMFSSGTTGKPKCIVHSHGGVLLKHITELSIHADLTLDDSLFYFTTCGWMMWNWMVSGLLCGSRLVLYDGNPFYPSPDKLLEIFSQEKVTLAGVSAKLIEGLSKAGVKTDKFDLSSLRMICSTGSPLSTNGFNYVYKSIKKDLCLASISGGTDIIGCFVMGVASLPVYSGEIQAPTLGMDIKVYDETGKEVMGKKGELVCCNPFPSVPIKFLGDDDNKSKLRKAYFSKFKGVWTHGDYAERTINGGFIIYGRSDNTLNPGGVRIGTAEVYRQVEKIDQVIDSIAVDQEWQDDTRIVLFVILRKGIDLDGDLEKLIKESIRSNTSPRHVPAKIIQVQDLPCTISGKLSEEAVRCAIHNLPLNNLDALANPESLNLFKNLPQLSS